MLSFSLIFELMKFSEFNINKPLINALEEMGFEEATPIQEKCFKKIMAGTDLVGIAQTGTGKTVAYLLPILRQLKYSEQKHPRVLIVVPTRELVVQVCDELEKLTPYMSIRIKGVFGGTNINTQKQNVHEGSDIIVATPGRLLDLALSGVLRLKKVQQVVIDEVDTMLDLGFLPQLTNLFDILPQRRQNLMFSATMTRDVKKIIEQFFHQAEHVKIDRSEAPDLDIDLQLYRMPNFHTKLNLVESLVRDEKMTKVLLFASTKKLADQLYDLLNPEEKEATCAVIHSNKSQNYRLRSVAAFDRGELPILIATDIVSRGLDFEDISHVINFDLPETAEDFTHRIGRTARAGKSGIALSLVSDFEEEHFDRIIEEVEGKTHLLQLPEEVEISEIYTEEERPNLGDKNYLPRR